MPSELREKSSPDPGGSDKPFGFVFIDLLGVLAAWRKFIVRFMIVSTLGAVLLALVLPKWYKATAIVFPAEQAEIPGGLEGVSSIMKSFGGAGRLGSLSGPSETEKYIAILGSESALMDVIEKFDLTRVYDITKYPREKTMKELLSNIDFTEGDGGVLGVNVYDRDPRRATDMANYFLEVLNEINSSLHSQNARGNRIFIEQRYQQNLEDIKNAEDSLHAFQMKNGIIALPEQLEATIKAGTEIYGKIAAKEIELEVMKHTLSESHPAVREAEMEIHALRDKLGDFNTGRGTSHDEMKILVPLGKAPQLGLEYFRLFR
ncbi:MAG TPA: Wzz/FepE/Etk N-terminal domain-containing protein, partial [Bacteroidota bacterium]|nr:Wzz/FepE/Etk N-terminal domain-containing protein [Bacteroidota bacterium]